MQEQFNELTKNKLQEYGPTIAELGYEPVKPGDNNNKPAQSSIKVDGPCNNVGRFLLNIFFLYGRNATWLVWYVLHTYYTNQAPYVSLAISVPDNNQIALETNVYNRNYLFLRYRCHLLISCI